MVNQTCVWWTDLCHSGPVWQKLAAFRGPQKISQTFGESAFAKFREKNAIFVIFCDKALYLYIFATEMSLFQILIPQNTRLLWKYFGLGSGIAKIIGSRIGYPSDTARGPGAVPRGPCSVPQGPLVPSIEVLAACLEVPCAPCLNCVCELAQTHLFHFRVTNMQLMQLMAMVGTADN